MTRLPLAERSALAPGVSTIVVNEDSTIAGPTTSAPGPPASTPHIAASAAPGPRPPPPEGPERHFHRTGPAQVGREGRGVGPRGLRGDGVCHASAERAGDP